MFDFATLGAFAIVFVIVLLGALAIIAFAFYRVVLGSRRFGALADRAIELAEEQSGRQLEQQQELQRQAITRRVTCTYCESVVDLGDNCPNCGASLPA